MKFLSVLFLTIVCLYANAQQSVTIEGDFVNKTSELEITIENYLNPSVFQLKTEIKEGKSFSFSFEAEKEEIYKLSTSKSNFIGMVILPGEKINLLLFPDELGAAPVIQGSPATKFIYDVNSSLASYAKEQDSLNNVYRTVSPTDMEKRKEIEEAYFKVDAEKNVFLANELSKNAGSLAALFFIEQLNIDQYFPLYERVDSLLSLNFSDHPAIIGFHNKVVGAKATAVGAIVPDIKLADTANVEQSLYSIKDAKIIIIDFWASWCKPCRNENPNMVKRYADYHDKGLEIFGVSLDKKRSAWVNAIASDFLTWLHVSDLKGWSSSAAALYGVSSIPSMFIIDATNFKILAKNIRGEQLRSFISGKLD